METKRTRNLAGIALAGALALIGSTARADRGAEIEGTYLNDVTIVTCPPAPRVVITRVQSMTTFAPGGVVIEGGGPPAPPPAISRSAGYGIWERTGHHMFRVFFRAHFFDNVGRLVRISEVRTNPKLIQGDNPDTPDVVEPFYLKGTGTNEMTTINPVDGSVISVTDGCNEATSRPLLFED
jgi:hypothetical protein